MLGACNRIHSTKDRCGIRRLIVWTLAASLASAESAEAWELFLHVAPRRDIRSHVAHSLVLDVKRERALPDFVFLCREYRELAYLLHLVNLCVVCGSHRRASVTYFYLYVK